MSDPEKVVPDFSVKVDGSPIPQTVREAVITIEVQQSLELIDMFTLVLDNPHGQIGDMALFDEGKVVEIELGWVGHLEKVLKADIVSLEPVWPLGTTPFITVRGYDQAHRLARGRKTRTFLKQKVSDIVSQLASEDGLSADCEDTQLVHEYLLQNNQTNIELIYELARRHYFEVEVVPGESKLLFKKPRSNKPKSFSLKWGKDLKSFYVRESTAEVATEVVALGWDPKTKKAITHKTKDVHGSLAASSSPAIVKKAFEDNPFQVSTRPVVAPAEAEGIAFAAFNERALASVRGHGTCVGALEVKPGIVLELDGLGATWTGTYYVTGATHVLHRAAGYATEFRVARTGA